MFEILFLAFAITMLLRWPEDVRRMRERKRSALPFGPEYQRSTHAADHTPSRRKLALEAELSESDYEQMAEFASLQRYQRRP